MRQCSHAPGDLGGFSLYSSLRTTTSCSGWHLRRRARRRVQFGTTATVANKVPARSSAGDGAALVGPAV